MIKALMHLQNNAILTTQRGIGYFLTDSASANTIALKRRQFIDEELPQVFASLKLLGLTMTDLQDIYRQRNEGNEIV